MIYFYFICFGILTECISVKGCQIPWDASQSAESYQLGVGDWNWTWVLWKSHQLSEQLSHLSSPSLGHFYAIWFHKSDLRNDQTKVWGQTDDLRCGTRIGHYRIPCPLEIKYAHFSLCTDLRKANCRSSVVFSYRSNTYCQCTYMCIHLHVSLTQGYIETL